MKKIFLSLLISLSFLIFSQSNENIKDLVKNNPELVENYQNQMDSDYTQTIGKDTSIDEVIENKNDIDIDNEEPNIFGFEYINTIPKSISSTSDLPVPNDYVVSLGDKLKIILTGGEKGIYDLTVGMDGNILFPDIGSISVADESIRDVREKVEQLIELSYVGTKVSISLDSLAARKINIIGAVKNPGTYIVSPFSTITSSLSYSGGFEEYASLRNITVIREGEEINFDLYDFLIFGSRESDINIRQGDTISIKSTNNFVEILGAINRSMIYEYMPQDTYSDLINFALGLNRHGDDKNITATLIEGSRKLTKKVRKDSFIDKQNIEALYIGNNVNINSRDVFVSGDSVTSGFYEVTEDKKLEEFLENLQFSSEIYPFYSIYERVTARGLSKISSSFSLSDPDTYSNLMASKNTTLSFFGRDQIDLFNSGMSEIEDSSLQIIRSEDLVSISLPDKTLSIPLKGKISPKQIHLFFGSFNEIDEGKVSVITNKGIFTNAYEITFDSEDLVAISFPSIKENIIEVTIEGEILNAGTYFVPSSTNLSDLYTLAGGLRNEAFTLGIQVFREEIKEKQIKAIREAKAVLTDAMIHKSSSISDRGMLDIESILLLSELADPTGRVAGNFDPNSATSSSFVLKEGDLISIPSMSYEVIVQGEVLNSSSFIFNKSMKYKDYIEAAGGFSDYADKRAVFIIRANGLSVETSSSIFSGETIIYPGDTIVVPRNLDQFEALPLVSMATNIIADIAFSAASLNAISD